MKCPNCNYKHGWQGCDEGNTKSKEGEFYKLPIEAKRDNPEAYYGGPTVSKDVYGCPKCGMMFMEVV